MQQAYNDYLDFSGKTRLGSEKNLENGNCITAFSFFAPRVVPMIKAELFYKKLIHSNDNPLERIKALFQSESGSNMRSFKGYVLSHLFETKPLNDDAVKILIHKISEQLEKKPSEAENESLAI